MKPVAILLFDILILCLVSFFIFSSYINKYKDKGEPTSNHPYFTHRHTHNKHFPLHTNSQQTADSDRTYQKHKHINTFTCLCWSKYNSCSWRASCNTLDINSLLWSRSCSRQATNRICHKVIKFTAWAVLKHCLEKWKKFSHGLHKICVMLLSCFFFFKYNKWSTQY